MAQRHVLRSGQDASRSALISPAASADVGEAKLFKETGRPGPALSATIQTIPVVCRIANAICAALGPKSNQPRNASPTLQTGPRQSHILLAKSNHIRPAALDQN